MVLYHVYSGKYPVQQCRLTGLCADLEQYLRNRNHGDQQLPGPTNIRTHYLRFQRRA